MSRVLSSTTRLRLLVIVILLLGIFFRFANLERKVYWIDETYSSLRISGYTEVELVQQLSQSPPMGIEDLQKYQRVNSERGVIDTIKGLAVEEPQLPPLYFVTARFWTQVFGNSVASVRSLSAVFSLLTLPGIYWLCLELFESSLTGWIAVAFLSVSPFYLLYAQEARPYSLWGLAIVLSSVALLRAMRVEKEYIQGKRIYRWSIYAATVALGLYSYLYFALVVIGHGIYIVLQTKLRLTKTLAAFIFASSMGLFAFSPWIVVLIVNGANINNKTSWQSIRRPFLFLVTNWLGNLSRIFIDFGLNANSPSTYLILLIPLVLIVLFLIGYSVYFIYRQADKKVWLFVLTSILIPALALILPDLIAGGFRSTHSRYLVPTYIGIQLAVAYCFATQLTSPLIKTWQKKLWQLALITLLSVGVISCAISSTAETWWTKYNSIDNPQIARILNSDKQPLLISDTNTKNINFTSIGNFLSLSYIVTSTVQFQLLVNPSLGEILNTSKTVFLLNISDSLKNQLEQEHRLHTTIVHQSQNSSLLKLVK